MTELEDQLARYARSITEDRPLIPERSGRAAQPDRRQRVAFMSAAAVLVIAVLVVGVLALRGNDNRSAATVTDSDDTIDAFLTVSDTTPGPTDTVTASVTVTNTTDMAIDAPSPCRVIIGIVTDSPDKVRVETDSELIKLMFLAQAGSALFRPADAQTYKTVTIDDLEAAATAGDTGPLTAKADACGDTPATTTLDPGESYTATKALKVGELGLPAGPGRIKATVPGHVPAIDLAVDVTIPDPTTTPISRNDAINVAFAQPEVAALVANLPASSGPSTTLVEPIHDDSPTPTAPDHTPPADTGADGEFTLAIAWPTEDGWQIGYAAGGQAALVTVAYDGTVTAVRTSQ